MKAPAVSVILPVYNSEKYIGEAIKSVLAQSFKDFELIVINDGSSDRSCSIIESFRKTDRRIDVISRENRGLIYSLNEGIERAQGQWVMRMDADDICTPERMSQQLAWLNSTGADVSGAWIRTFGHTVPRLRRFYRTEAAIKLQLLFNSCFAHPTVMGRRTLFGRFQYKSTEKHVEDYGLWTRMASAGIQLTNYPGVVLYYRIHRAQVTVSQRMQQAPLRSQIARCYAKQCFADSSIERVHADLMDRETIFSRERNLHVMTALKALIEQYGDPEGVVSSNAFIYLARHAELGLKNMRSCFSDFSLTTNRQLILLLLASLKAHQNSFLYNFLYKLN